MANNTEVFGIMKKTGSILLAIFLGALPLYSQNVSIPDTAFFHAVLDNGVDTNGDSLVSFEEARATKALWVPERGISDLRGIEAFMHLDSLDCERNQLASF